MEAQLILAEAATHHPDGTVSMLRAGITHLWGVKGPYLFNGVLLLRILSDLADQGTHDFDLRCLNADGGQMMPGISGQFDAPETGTAINVIMGLDVKFPETGRYIFYLRVDKSQVAELAMTCATRPKKKA